MRPKLALLVFTLFAILTGIIVVVRQRGQSSTTGSTWNLSDPQATYIIYGAADFGYGPGYYLYMTREGNTSVAKVDANKSVDLKHYTDRPVVIEGNVRSGQDDSVIVTITAVRRKE